MLQRIRDRRTARDEGGFTLIELLVVIIILGILAAVVVFAVGGIGSKGEKESCRIDTRTLRTAQEAYAAQAPPSGGGGNYATEAQLVPNFLSQQSTYHNIANVNNTANPKTFDITVEDPRCGTVGNVVNGTTDL